MFEDFKTGFITEKLKTLSKYSRELIDIGSSRGVEKFLPFCKKTSITYAYHFHKDNEVVQRYQFTMGNITYGFEEERGNHAFVYIKVNDIVIYHNQLIYCCEGKFEDVASGWNHIAPKEMLAEIKEGNEIIAKYIKEIKLYLKCLKIKPDDPQYLQEEAELERIFCKKKL